MLKNLKISSLKAAFLALLPLLLQVKFSFTGGAPSLTWPPLATAFPDFNHVAPLALFWLELLVRVVPSAENLSLVKLLHDVLEQVVPNRASGGGFHVLDATTTDDDQASGTGLTPA